MITHGDRVLVGVSGGADSLTLLSLMAERQRHVPPPFVLVAAHIDGGFPGSDPQNLVRLESHFQSLDVPYRIIKAPIAQKALDPQATKNPCFICAHERRRAIYHLAHELGCNKIAYAHHKDDIIETLLLNILYGRRVEAMHPVQEVFGGSMHIIRPLALTDEWQVKAYAREQALPTWPKVCPIDGNSRRQKIKELIRTLQAGEKNANIRENIFKAMHHVNLDMNRPGGSTRR